MVFISGGFDDLSISIYWNILNTSFFERYKV